MKNEQSGLIYGNSSIFRPKNLWIEYNMLHEAVFALGGYPGTLFSEDGDKKDGFFEHLHPCERVLADRISRVATHYLTLKKFIDNNVSSHNFEVENLEGTRNQGSYMQAFCNALSEVLQPYREDIASLEKEIINDPYLSLSHVTYRAEKYGLFLNVLNRMVHQLNLEGLRGCQILGFLKRHLASGVDELKDAVGRILYNCHMFFYKQLTSWLLYGHLMDKHNEFFIEHRKETIGTSVANVRSDTYMVEESTDNKTLYPAFCDYGINFSMLPHYIPASIAYKILFVGQTILMFSNTADGKNSIREIHKGSTSVWGIKEEEFLRKLQALQHLPKFDLDKFETTINEIRSCVTEHLWHIAVEKAEMFQQLRLIKDFFLLGRGELFLEFIRQITPILMRTTSSREVNEAFQIAARKVLLTDESALDKFSFVLESKDNLHGNKSESSNTYWEKLGLQYKVSWPLHLLFTPDTLEHYNMLFKFLLRVKRVQADLHSTWMEHIQACKTSQGSTLQPCVWQLRTGLAFLVDNLQYYLQADVLESQYVLMQNTIQNTQDFEKVQQAHAVFQTNILSQTFLRISTHKKDTQWSNHSIIPTGGSGSDPVGSDPVDINHVQRILDRILSLSELFCECSRKWSNPLRDEELDELLDMDKEFFEHVEFLMQLFFSLRSEPCGAHLSQLLLRLDFNRWYSHSSSHKSIDK